MHTLHLPDGAITPLFLYASPTPPPTLHPQGAVTIVLMAVSKWTFQVRAGAFHWRAASLHCRGSQPHKASALPTLPLNAVSPSLPK